MNTGIDYYAILQNAWVDYGSKRRIVAIEDVSANVSTNKVFRMVFDDASIIMAKVSNFGSYENFKEDHQIINVMSNNLEYPYDLFLSSSLMKNNDLYLYRYEDKSIDVWLVFYRVVRIKNKLPKRLTEDQIRMLGSELARFHKLCDTMTPVLPKSSKTLQKDIHHLLRRLEKEGHQQKFQGYSSLVKEHCELFLENSRKLESDSFLKIPVFVDWNIGNFSVRDNGSFFSRWDYDWFRMSSRVLDFYSFSRVVSDIGDKTDFSYTSTQLREDRFLLFLQEYHKVFPLTKNEVLFMKEAYRFFILNYVIASGKYFFNESYANKLQKEAYELYLPELEKVCDFSVILDALSL